MRNLFIEAQDVWLFRDGRPFDAGSAHRAESMFLPYPSVIQGAIRSNQLVLEGVDLTTGKHKDGRTIQQIVGDPLTFDGALNLNGLTLRGPFVARRSKEKDGEVERLFHLPADAYYLDGGGVKSATPHKRTSERVSGKSKILLIPGSDAVKPRGLRWLTQSELKEYFKGNAVEGVEQDKLFQKESRFGIGRNSEWVTKKGMLYEAGFIRPVNGVGLLVQMSGYDHAGWESGLLQLGGEGRAAHYSTVQVADLPNKPDPLPRYFKIYFSTSTYFKNGAEPESWGRFFDGDVQLAAYALRNHDSISGFDWAKKPDSREANRASRRYVPAGSVYYFENIKDGKLTKDAITEFGAELGFGQFILSSSKEW